MAKNVFAGTGISNDGDSYHAGKAAAQMAVQEMEKKGGKKPTFGLIFCSGSKYGKDKKTIQKLVDGVNDVFKNLNPKMKWVGCTTAGEISNYGVTEGSCVALCLSSDYLHIGVGIGEGVTKTPLECGKKATKMALKDLSVDKLIHAYISYLTNKLKDPNELVKINPYCVLNITAGNSKTRNIRTDDVITGIKEVVGYRIPIVGGSAGDDLRLEGTYEFANGKVYEDSVITTIIMSDVKFSYVSKHGYCPTSNVFLVSKTKGDIILELNGKPALEEYAKALNMNIEDVRKNIFGIGMQFPFGFSDVEGQYIIKAPGIVIENGLLCAAKVPQNTILSIMKANKEDLLRATKEAIEETKNVLNGKLAFGFIANCAMRKLLLREGLKDEFKIIQQKLGDTPFIGFYTYGEVAATKGAVSMQQNIQFNFFLLSDDLITV